MRRLRSTLVLFLAASLVTLPALASKTNRTAASSSKSRSAHKVTAASKSGSKSRGTGKGKKAQSHKLHGQQAIDAARVTEIQQALIREHYLNGEADGQWDSTTQAAMQKYQADQGWQTRLMPDSRALKKLGLGPDYSTAINAAKDTGFGAPAPASTLPAEQASGFAAAAGVN